MIRWIAGHRFLAGAFALLLIVAVGSAVGGYRYRSISMQYEKELKAANETKRKEIEAAKREWAKAAAASDRKIDPIIRERDNLRARLRDVEAKRGAPFVPPANEAEIVNRFAQLGYSVRIIGTKK